MKICYISPKRDLTVFDEAKKELYRIKDVKKRVAIAGAITTISLCNINELLAKDLKIAKFTQKVDSVGNQFLELVQLVGYWAALIFAGIDVIKNIKKQDIAGSVAIVLKYVFVGSMLYALPWIFDLFKDMFS